MADDTRISIQQTKAAWLAVLRGREVLDIAQRMVGRLVDRQCGDSLDVEAMYAADKLNKIEEILVPALRQIEREIRLVCCNE